MKERAIGEEKPSWWIGMKRAGVGCGTCQIREVIVLSRGRVVRAQTFQVTYVKNVRYENLHVDRKGKAEVGCDPCQCTMEVMFEGSDLSESKTGLMRWTVVGLHCLQLSFRESKQA
jgi:hypothetical protein